jgi:hypothetical protein
MGSGARPKIGTPTDAEIDAAVERGRIARRTEPRAASARYDPSSGRVIVELTNGCIFAFPARLAQGSETATDEQLGQGGGGANGSKGGRPRKANAG